jgi:4-amino-4-deoxy-L-arabinose transferase-like glycosyltransferase
MSFHGDESAYLTMGVRATNLVLAGKWNDPQWLNNSLLGAESPPVTSYLLGFGLRLFGIQSGEWPYWDAPNPTAPPSNVLLIGRAVISLTAYATLFVVYFLGKELKDAKTGLIGVLLFGLNPLWLITSRRAMSEAPAILFSTLAVLLLFRGMREKSKRDLALCGVSLGLAINSKYNAIFLCVILVCYFCLWIAVNCWNPDSQGRSMTCMAKWFGSLVLPAVITTVVINPVLYPNPIAGIFFIAHYWMGGTPNFFTPSLLGASTGIWVLAVCHVLVFPCLTVLKVLWPSYPLPSDLAASGTISTATTSLFFVTGLSVVFWRVYTAPSLKNSILSLQGFLLFWFVGEAFLVGDTVRFAWDRYFLPVLPPIVLIAALSLVWLDGRLTAKGAGVRLVRQFVVALYLLSQFSAVLAFYPELYQGTFWGNVQMYGTIQQSIYRPLGQISLLLFFAAIACTLIALQWNSSKITGMARPT